MPHLYLETLNKVSTGEISPEEALQILGRAPFEQLMQGLNLDTQRELRTGLGEVVFAQGKSTDDLVAAVEALAGAEGKDSLTPVLVTRASEVQGSALEEAFPEGQFWSRSGLFCLGRNLSLAAPWPHEGELIIVTAGASDYRVGLEALGTARFFGLEPGFIPDVGVAGLHRLTPYLPHLSKARLIIAVAGMEGALPGVLAGLFSSPVLAVPSSIGYGVSEGGRAALAGMLASCAPGLAVFNIDNGFGAAAFAAKLLQPTRRIP